MFNEYGRIYKFSYKKGIRIDVETAFIFFDVETLVDSDDDDEKITVVAYEVYHYNTDQIVERTVLVNRKTANINIESKDIVYFNNQNELVRYFTNHILNLFRLFGRVIVVSHNFHFDRIAIDIKRLFNELELDIVSFDRVFFVLLRKKIANRLHMLVLNDNMNYYPMSIKFLGKVFGKEKMVADYDNPSKELIDYVFRDVEILRESHLYVVKKVVNELGKERYFLTLSSLSMALFDKYASEPIFYHTNKEIKSIERASYKGGRNENRVFGIVKGKIFKLDVNSEYPFMMISKEFPVMPVYYANYDENRYYSIIVSKQGRIYFTDYKKISFSDLWEKIQNGEYLAIIDATIDIMDDSIGLRADITETEVDLNSDILSSEIEIIDPYEKVSANLVFPIGKNIRVVITSPELVEFKDYIRIRKVHKVIMYRKGKPFRKFVAKFYGERVKSKINNDKPKDILYKLILNTLSGKFAQHVKYDVVINLEYDPFPDKDFVTFYDASTSETIKKIFGRAFVVLTEDEQDFVKSTVAISSFITAYGRIYITKLIKLVEENGGKVYYYDTDSLHVDEVGYKILKENGFIANSHELGKLKVEGVYDAGIYITNKQYILLKDKDDKYLVDIVFGGVPQKVILQYLHNKGLIWNTKGVNNYIDYYLHHRDFDFDIYTSKNKLVELFTVLLFLDIEYETIAKTKETLNKVSKNTILITRRRFTRNSIKFKRIYIKKDRNYYESKPYYKEISE